MRRREEMLSACGSSSSPLSVMSWVTYVIYEYNLSCSYLKEIVTKPPNITFLLFSQVPDIFKRYFR